MTDEEKLKKLRKRMFVTAYKNGITHLASAYSSLEILYVLYMKGLISSGDAALGSRNRDRFILSKGHAAIALYAVLEEAGLLKTRELDTFLKSGTRLGGEPCRRDLDLIETSTGSLGHGLTVATGLAIAQKVDDLNARTFCLIGDGESEEGTVWEAAMSAVSFKLNNLTVILDHNHLQKNYEVSNFLGKTKWNEKWDAFGWNVKEVDGHDIQAIYKALAEPANTERPTIIIANTIKGKGVSIMENNFKWHFRMPNRKELKGFMEELDISEEEILEGV